MRKTLIKILLTSIILLWLWNINGANAGEFTCSLINTEINNYSDYKSKIDNLFTKLSKKDEATKNKYYKKISSVTNKYLQKLDKIKQKKFYTIIGYLKCKNEKTDDKIWLSKIQKIVKENTINMWTDISKKSKISDEKRKIIFELEWINKIIKKIKIKKNKFWISNFFRN